MKEGCDKLFQTARNSLILKRAQFFDAMSTFAPQQHQAALVARRMKFQYELFAGQASEA